MLSKITLITVLIYFFNVSIYCQTSYSTSITATGGENYSVSVTITPTAIVPVQSTCDWGYNYDVAYNYDIQIVGGDSPALYTLSGYLSCGSNQGIYFDLPNSGGSGSNVTQGNPWTNNSDCATATLESLDCNSIDLVIEGAGIPNQTITLDPATGDNGDDSEWDTNGNSCDTTAFIGTTNSSDLRFRTNNLERMRLTEDGKFGIGVTNPLEKFELQGTMKLSEGIIFSEGKSLTENNNTTTESNQGRSKGKQEAAELITQPSSNDIVIYPNPNTGSCVVKVPEEQIGGSYAIVNTNGTIIQSGVFQNKTTEKFDLPKGLYYFQWRFKGKYVVKKIIVI